MNDYAALLLDTGEPASAETLLRDALPVARRTEGDHGPLVASTLDNLGHALQRQGKLAEVEPIFQESLKISRKLHGDGHPELIRPLIVLAEFHHRVGELPEAERLAREALAICDGQTDVPPDERQRGVIDVVSRILLDSGKPDEAVTIRRGFVEACRRLSPPDHALLCNALGPLGLLLLEQQKYAEAEPLLRECLEIRTRVLQPGSPDFWLVGQTRSLLAESLIGQAGGLPDPDRERALALLGEAEPLVVDSYQWLSENFELINPALPLQLRQDRVRQAGERVVRLYGIWDAAEPGQGYAEKAAEWRQKLESQKSSRDGPSEGPAP